MKKFLSIILAISIFLAVIPFGTFTVSAENTSGSCGYNNVAWKYDTETDTLTVFGSGAMSNYSSALYNGDYFTTAPWKSFHEKIKTVIIESGVTSIGDFAFYRCEQLASVIISNTVLSIGSFAFSSSHEITNITIPDSVVTIGSYSFACSNKLNNIIIPDSVTSLGEKAFWSCTGLDSITIHDNILIDESAFDNCKIKNLIISRGSETIKSNMVVCKSTIKCVFIPDSVTSIGEKAFSDCTGLTSITIPNSVTSIGDRAFNGCTGLKSAGPIGGGYNIEFAWTDKFPSGAFNYCTGLTSVVIPDTVKSIGTRAFAGCDNLKSITIPNSVTEICDSAFSGCGLESIAITNGVTSIGDYAFTCCYSLKSITIADSVTSIGKSAFQQCTKLININIPDSVTSIGSSAFFMCTELKSAKMSNGMTSISGYMFRDCTALTSIIIPESVTSISERAFYCCSGLQSITIPKSVNYIGIYAFNSCKNLRTVYYKGTVKQRSEIYIASTGNSYFINATWYHINCNHNETKIINYRPASCSNAGYTGDVYCCDCDRIINSGEAIPAIGYHNYSVAVKNPTCIAQGYTTHTCTRCGDSYIDNYVYMSCGANCGFIINNNILYIHGKGDTDNYKTQTIVPWYDYADSIIEIQIDEGITKIGSYAFYCLNNLKSIKTKNNNLAFGKYAINSTNTDITVFAENGGTLETYCAENNINYIDPTITPELQTATANSITVKAVDGYEYSTNGITWKKINTFSGLSPAREYSIYARYAATADMFDTIGAPLNVTTLKSTVATPAAPDYQSHTDSSITLVANDLYEFSIDGDNWQKSSKFTGLSKNTVYRFYQRIAETETEFASPSSAPLVIAIPDKPEILEAGYENILLKKIDGFEYCLDDFIWQDSNEFDMLIDNTEYYVYQKLKAVDGEKVYQITSDYTAVTTDNSIKPITHTSGDINGDASVNNKDLTRLFQYLSGWNVDVNEVALDINGDGKVNNKDLTRLFQYLSGWNVEIF